MVVSSHETSFVFFFQAEDGIRDLVRSRGLGDVYKRQGDCRRSSGTDVQAVQNGFLCYKTSDRMTRSPRDHHSFRCTNWSGQSGDAENRPIILRISCGVFPCACGECGPQSPHLARRMWCTSGSSQTGRSLPGRMAALPHPWLPVSYTHLTLPTSDLV